MPLLEAFPYEYEMSKAQSLLETGETLPFNVEKTIEYCTRRNIGFILSRNPRVLSCRDARSNRDRLGHRGIPLYDELKSIVLIGTRSSGDKITIVAHCRGNTTIDFEALSKICELTQPPIIMEENELQGRYGVNYGTVTPFVLDADFSGEIITLFDESVLSKVAKYPGTMMTNAGEHTWGVEFDPVDLVDKTEIKKVSKFATPDKELHPYELPTSVNPKSIGIITGNGPDSGIALWNGINRFYTNKFGDNFLGDIALPRVSLSSLPAMGFSMELDKRNSATWEALSRGVKSMVEQDVDLLALACHTTHYYTDRIREIFEQNGKKFISMPEIVKKYINDTSITDMAILGIDFVSDFKKFKQYSAYADLDVLNVELLSSEVISKFKDLGFAVKKMNNNNAAFRQFINLVKSEIKSENVIIALTEFSILYQSQFKKRGNGKNIIDSLELYANAIAEESIKPLQSKDS